MGLKGGIRSRLLYNLHASKATNRRITSHFSSRAARFRISRRTACFRYSRGCRSDFSSQGDASEVAAHFIGLRAGTMGTCVSLFIPSSIAPEEQHNERPTADTFMFD